MMFRQSLIHYAEKKGVTKAAIKYNVSRQYVNRWKNRYDGTLQSLADKSHRPHSHPNQHTEDEIGPVRDMRRRNPHAGLVAFWVKLRQRGYSRSITGLYRVLRRPGEPRKTLPNPKYIPKPSSATELRLPMSKHQANMSTRKTPRRIRWRARCLYRVSIVFIQMRKTSICCLSRFSRSHGAERRMTKAAASGF